MIKRGHIYFVSLNPTQGREQAGKRPVLVVSADEINSKPLVVVVVVGTDSQNLPRDYPTNVRVTAKETGLPKDTVFLCFQIRALDPARFIDPKAGYPVAIATMPASKMKELEKALSLTLGLEGTTE